MSASYYNLQARVVDGITRLAQKIAANKQKENNGKQSDKDEKEAVNENDDSMFSAKNIASFVWQHSDLDDIARSVFRSTEQKIKNIIMPTQILSRRLAEAVWHEIRTNYTMVWTANQNSLQYTEISVFENKQRINRLIPFETNIGQQKTIFKHKTENTYIMTDSWGDSSIIISYLYPRKFDKQKFIKHCLIQWEQHVVSSVKTRKQGRFEVNLIYRDDSNGSKIEVSMFGRDSKNESSRDGDYVYGINSHDIMRLNPKIDSSFMYTKEQIQSMSVQNDPFSNLHYNADVMETYIRASNWFNSEKWYNSKNLRWALGMLFHGKGGTGKTEMAMAIAKKLGIPIYVFYLSTLTNTEFLEEWNNMDGPCIALFEDFDNVFNKRKAINANQKLSFDCVLNAISGVNAREGVMLIITTNRIDYIDEAIGVSTNSDGLSSRPGRVDLVKEFGNMDYDCRYKFAYNFFDKDEKTARDISAEYDNVTPAQFQEVCTRLMYSQLDHTI